MYLCFRFFNKNYLLTLTKNKNTYLLTLLLKGYQTTKGGDTNRYANEWQVWNHI